MLNKKYYLYVLLAISLLSGCVAAVKGPDFKSADAPPIDTGHVYIYWSEETEKAPTVDFDILVGGKAITTMKRGGYYFYKSMPGQYDLESSVNFSILDMALLDMAMTSNLHHTLNVEAGRTYYIRCTLSGGHRGWKLAMEQALDKNGLNEIKNTKLLPSI